MEEKLLIFLEPLSEEWSNSMKCILLAVFLPSKVDRADVTARVLYEERDLKIIVTWVVWL